MLSATMTVSGAWGGQASMDTEGTHPFLAAQNYSGPRPSDNVLRTKVGSLYTLAASPHTHGPHAGRARGL